MNFEDFLKEKKEYKEKHKKEFLKEKKEAIKLLEKSEEAFIVIAENGSMLCGSGIDINSALTAFFATVMNDETFTKDEIMRCIKIAELVNKGKLEEFSNSLEALHDILGD